MATQAIVKKIKRELKGMSYNEMAELAEKVELSVTCLYWWQIGTTYSPLFDNVVAVANELGYKISMELK
jgi:hypothetical protein